METGESSAVGQPRAIAHKADPNLEAITIAITIYDRAQYLSRAIRSAIAQQKDGTHPKVIVVEDCGPNPQIREAVAAEFAGKVGYHRNSYRRGLFDNWNACLELSRTPWLCILHDDDFLEPNFVDAMIELAEAAPGRALYYGACHVIDDRDKRIEERQVPRQFCWSELDLMSWARYDPVCFPGQLFNVPSALALGGFRASSRYCADWEMWFKLAATHGAAATNRVVANYREHRATSRGTTAVDVSGRKYALVNAQRKRHLAWLRKTRPTVRFDRRALQKRDPMPVRFLLENAHGFSPLMLRYNAGLLLRSGSPHLRHLFFRALAALFTWRIFRFLSKVFQFVIKLSASPRWSGPYE